MSREDVRLYVQLGRGRQIAQSERRANPREAPGVLGSVSQSGRHARGARRTVPGVGRLGAVSQRRLDCHTKCCSQANLGGLKAKLETGREPANRNLQPIVADNVQIIGKVVMSIRRYA